MSWKVPRYNYKNESAEFYPALKSDLAALTQAGDYILGREVSRFESDFGRFIGAPFCITVNSGTDAIIISLLALGVGPGDEVITQANTFYATVAAICLVGATPVLVDADEDSYLMDIGQVPAVVSHRSKAVIPVHLFGKATSMDGLEELRAGHGISIIEDAAQAHGAADRERSVGSIGDLGCFSFHPSKNLAAWGDGGAIITWSAKLDAELRILRALGQMRQNEHVRIGLNSKLDTIQAYVLRRKLRKLHAWNGARQQIAKAYIARLSRLPLRFQSPEEPENNVYHLFQLRTERRDQLLKHLRDARIDSVVRYPTPIHMHKAFAKFGWKPGQFPVSERLCNESLCLPLRPDMTEAEVDYVCNAIEQFFN